MIATAALALACSAAQAPLPAPVPSVGTPDFVADAVERAPVILSGWLAAAPAVLPRGAGSRLQPPVDVMIALDRVIKGQAAGKRVRIALTRFPALTNPDLGRYFIFFLEPSGTGYTSEPGVSFGAMPAAPVRAAGATPQATVEAMLSTALLLPQTRATGGDVLIMMFVEGDRSRNPLLTKAFEAELQPPNLQARGEAIAALVARGSEVGLNAASDYIFMKKEGLAWSDIDLALVALATPPAIQILADQATSAPTPRMEAIGLIMLGETGSPKALPILANALRTGTADSRTAAALGLGNLRAPAGVPLLGKALDDPDENVRFDACRSLIAIKENVPAAALDTKDFQKHEADYIRQWRQWAHDHSPGGGQP